MNQASYFHLSLSKVPASLEDELSAFCFSWGANGVSQDLAFRQPELEYNPEILPMDMIQLSAFFATRPEEEFFLQLGSQFPEIEFVLQEEANRDWLAEWKKGFHPFCLAQDYWVVPSWCEVPRQAKYHLLIDPGMAFGTGTHATTQLAARLLVNLPPLRSMLDVGTGTGILSMLMKLRRTAKIVATEIDPVARETARTNLRQNQMTEIEVLETQVDTLDKRFELVVANIIDGVLLKLKEHLLRTCDGYLVLSGILLEREDHFIHEFLRGTDLKIQDRQIQDEWVAYLLKTGRAQ